MPNCLGGLNSRDPIIPTNSGFEFGAGTGNCLFLEGGNDSLPLGVGHLGAFFRILRVFGGGRGRPQKIRKGKNRLPRQSPKG